MRSEAEQASLDQYYGDEPRFLEHYPQAEDGTYLLPEQPPAPAPAEPAEDAPIGACRHIMTGGKRCGSPALRRENFCYYHHTTRKPAPRHGIITRRNTQLDLPSMEDRSAVQHSIGEVLRLIAEDGIDPRRAGLLLYGLQIASHNLPPEDARSKAEETVADVVLDPEQGMLALPAEYRNTKRERTLEEILVEQWDREKLLVAEDAERERKRREVDEEVQSHEDFAAKQGEGVS